MSRPTAEEVRAMPAGGELDALVAALVCGREVVCMDWPCGYHHDYPISAAMSRTQDRSGDEPWPVMRPLGYGVWPPIKKGELFPDYYSQEALDSASPELRELMAASLEEEIATVEPVPSYSASWSDAGPLLEVWRDWTICRDHWCELIYEYDDKAGEAQTIRVEFDDKKPNDLCRAIAIVRVLAALVTAEPDQTDLGASDNRPLGPDSSLYREG